MQCNVSFTPHTQRMKGDHMVLAIVTECFGFQVNAKTANEEVIIRILQNTAPITRMIATNA